MTKAIKTGLILFIIGACLPTAALPFITEFRPHPELCLTSNFFTNMGNMMLPLGPLLVPYRYLFSFGVILACVGLGTIVVSYPSARNKR